MATSNLFQFDIHLQSGLILAASNLVAARNSFGANSIKDDARVASEVIELAQALAKKYIEAKQENR